MSANTTPTRRPSTLTAATYIPSGVLIALVAVYAYLSSQMYAGALSDAAYAASCWYGTLLMVLFAVIVIAVALRIGVRQHVGAQWLLIGLGVASFAVGDIVWTVLDLHMGLDPYPSVADAFYILEYVFFVIAMVLAIRSYRELVPTRQPIIVGMVIAAILVVGVYLVLLGPYIFSAGVAELGFWGLVVSTLYPLADVVLMLAPALTLALVIRKLGGGRLAWPWWVVVVGALVFAVTDTAYSHADWAGTGLTSWLEMGWMSANLIFAIAAIVAREAYKMR